MERDSRCFLLEVHGNKLDVLKSTAASFREWNYRWRIELQVRIRDAYVLPAGFWAMIAKMYVAIAVTCLKKDTCHHSWNGTFALALTRYSR